MIDLRQGDCLEEMKKIRDESVDAVVTDPPYLYLKNQQFDKPFDEQLFFTQVKRILKKDGFIVMFGRGTSFYRWNTILSNMGFVFKEEIIWEKERNTSPFSNLLRFHETISIFTKGNGIINKVKIPYIEARENNLEGIISDIKRLRVTFKNFSELEEVEKYLESGLLVFNRKKVSKFETTAPECKSISKCVAVARGIREGLVERDIMKEQRDYYNMQHPTQKPIRLMERLVSLVSKEEDIVLYPFMGSGSTGVACLNIKRSFIGIELDQKYFEIAKERIYKAQHEDKGDDVV